jgi:hypothetical protein
MNRLKRVKLSSPFLIRVLGCLLLAIAAPPFALSFILFIFLPLLAMKLFLIAVVVLIIFNWTMNLAP